MTSEAGATGQSLLLARALNLLEGALESALSSAGQLIVRGLCRFQTSSVGLQRFLKLAPLVVEAAEQRDDLLRGTLKRKVAGRLSYHRQHGKQCEWGATDDFAL